MPESSEKAPSGRRRPQEARTWHEYPLGLVTEGFAALYHTAQAMLVGTGMMGGLVFAVGLAGEEGALPSAELSKAIDMLTRFSLAALTCVTLAVWFLLCVAQLGWELGVSRALVRAAGAGASTREVPHPSQIELADRPAGSYLVGLIYSQAAVLGVFLVIGAPVIAFNPFDGAWLVLATPAAWIALLGLTLILVLSLRRRQAIRSAQLEKHWTPRSRRAAAERAARPARHRGGDRRGLMWLGTALMGLSGMLGGVAVLLVYGILLATHPDAQQWPGGQAGDRADLSPEAEALVDQLTIVFAGLAALAVLTALVGAVVQVLAAWRERAFLKSALDSSTGQQPPAAILQRHVGRRTVPAAQILAAAGGGILCLALAGIALGSSSVESFADVYRGSVDLFAPLRAAFEWSVGVSMALLGCSSIIAVVAGVRGRALRNELHARWPTAGKPKSDSD